MMLLMILLLFNKGMTHECVHDKIAKEIKHVPNHPYKEPTHSPIDGRLMQSDKRPLNIHFDFTYLDRNPDADFVTYIKHSILPQAQDTIKEFLYINDTITIQPFDRTGCDQFFAIPEYYTKTPVDADIIIFVTYEDVEESYLAYAAPCLKRSSNNRPIVGFISINKKHVVMAKDQVDPMVYLLIHEIFHILAMSPALYDSFQARQPVYTKETGTFNGQQTERWKFITPKLVEVAKEYYDCESITGVYLENNGATGNVASHFEKLHTGNELMVAQDVGFDTISVFSLALFEDTGWYIVDHSKAEYLSWGKGKGCSFYNNSTCQETIGEYCDSHNTRNCSPDYLTKTYCLDTPYSDGCLINEYFDDFICATPHQLQKTSLYEEVSNESRCFKTKMSGSNTDAGCYKASCADGKLVVTVQNKEYECETEGEEVKVGSFKLICPDKTRFCSFFNDTCADNCNGKGKCLIDKSCRCYHFWEGKTCETDKKCSFEEKDICAIINPDGEVGEDSNNNTEDDTENSDSNTDTNTDKAKDDNDTYKHTTLYPKLISLFVLSITTISI